jgi:hypothetical protein
MVPFYLAIAGSLMAVSYFGYVNYGRYVSLLRPGKRGWMLMRRE